jgi:hypothetical protein
LLAAAAKPRERDPKLIIEQGVTMAFITSRNFALPTNAKDLSAGVWHNMWGKKQWPYRELQEGMTLYWYEPPSGYVVWRSRVDGVERFVYESKDDVKKKLNLSPKQTAESYFTEAAPSGYCLSYKVQALQRLNLPKPTELRFPQPGWLRITKEVEQQWPGLSVITTTGFALPEEIAVPVRLIEGAVCRITVNAYERNDEARARCIERHGAVCCICGFDFGAMYGEVAEGYIHVHHVRPLSEIGKEYEVDPVADLRPVCPNCHAVVHMRGECRTIEEVKKLLDHRA